MTNFKILKLLAVLEGISTLVLFGISMPLKYFFEQPESIRPVGMAHGVLFIAYCVWVIIVALQQKWKISKTFWALAASLVPIGTFIADAKLFKVEKNG